MNKSAIGGHFDFDFDSSQFALKNDNLINDQATFLTQESKNIANVVVVSDGVNADFPDSPPLHHFLNIPYVVAEILVAILAVAGNCLVMVAFAKDKKLRRLTNYYIVSLAAADFLVGLLGVPFAVLTSIGLPKDFYACLFNLSVLIVLCTISIFNLVAVSVDRFWAILFPLEYSRLMTRKGAQGIIVVCWIVGTIVGFLPLVGWHGSPPPDDRCLFVLVMDYNFLVFLYFATIIAPSVLMGVFYCRIYCVVLKQTFPIRQISALEKRGQSRNCLSAQAQSTSPPMQLRAACSRRDVKAAKNLFVIVIFFVLCWIPLYTINCVKAFCVDCPVPEPLMMFTIVLSHVNSAGNPILYACHLRDFRDAMRRCLCGKSPIPYSSSFRGIPSRMSNAGIATTYSAGKPHLGTYPQLNSLTQSRGMTPPRASRSDGNLTRPIHCHQNGISSSAKNEVIMKPRVKSLDLETLSLNGVDATNWSDLARKFGCSGHKYSSMQDLSNHTSIGDGMAFGPILNNMRLNSPMIGTGRSAISLTTLVSTIQGNASPLRFDDTPPSAQTPTKSLGR